MSERVMLYTKPGCHLCDDARTVVASVCKRAGTGWQEVNISGSEHLMAQYGEMVPVVTVDGVQQGYWHIDPERLGAAVA